MTGKADVTMGGIALFLNDNFDFGSPMIFVEMHYMSRSPVPVTSYGNITKPFSMGVWMLSILCIGALSAMFYVAYKAYRSEGLAGWRLARNEESRANFLIYPFAKITEPDPLPWFLTWSTGTYLVFLWSLLSLFLNMFYTSNLRANMMTLDYERPIDTLEDIVANGQRVYIHDGATRHRYPYYCTRFPKSDLCPSAQFFFSCVCVCADRTAYLEATGQTGSMKYKVAKLAEETGGIYDPRLYLGMHKDAPLVLTSYCIDSGAAFWRRSSTHHA